MLFRIKSDWLEIRFFDYELALLVLLVFFVSFKLLLEQTILAKI